jgi:hypothetical protein
MTDAHRGDTAFSSTASNPRFLRRDTPPAYWFAQVAAWGAYGTLNAVAAVVMIHLPWQRAAVEIVLSSALGLALSHALGLFMRHHGWRAVPLRARIPRIIVASLIVGALAGLLTNFLGLAAWKNEAIAVGLPELQPLVSFFVQLLNWTLLFLLWSAFYFSALGIRDRKSAKLHEAQLARALQASELRLLKSQLNPHFLFNALNTVRALIADEPARAQTAVTQLARMLRYTLAAGQDDLVTLEQELAIVEDYLGIEALRLGERLRVEWDIAPQALDRRIPVMLLQMLVENAIKHGIAQVPAGGVLRIYAGLAHETLVLEVENPRPEHYVPAAQEGIGIDNARTRLLLLCGPRATLDLDLSHPRRALARVRLSLTA